MCRHVWPEHDVIEEKEKDDVKILLYLWHTRKACIENATQKIKTNYLRAEIWDACIDLMYGNEILQGELAVKAAEDIFEFLKAKYLQAKAFFLYFEKTWILKIEMWVNRYRNISHANQDTNAAVESYHAILKAIFRTSRQKFDGRRVNWLVYHLVKHVLVQYLYDVQCKLYRFIKNGKVEEIVANTVIMALEIPDEYVLICEDEDVA